jgi:Mn-dependent DtxR family transcriptional regulator
VKSKSSPYSTGKDHSDFSLRLAAIVLALKVYDAPTMPSDIAFLVRESEGRVRKGLTALRKMGYVSRGHGGWTLTSAGAIKFFILTR